MGKGRSHNILYRLALTVVIFASFFVSLVYAADSLIKTLDTLMSTGLGSSSSQTWFSTGGLDTTYYNRGNDTQIIGNYLSGYYFDTNYGYFELHWDNRVQSSYNVNISAKLTDSQLAARHKTGVYCYRFDGWAKSIETASGGENVGLIDFGYSDDIFVYYCDDDKKLHGYAYSDDLGFQSFEGIPFEIGTVSDTKDTLKAFSPQVDPYFVNNNSAVVAEIVPTYNSIQGDKVSTEGGKESIFYIVK